jgi:hypothetical protein
MGAYLAKPAECPVCLDAVDEPKLLACGHTVCRKCVDMTVPAQLRKCPECGRDTELSSGLSGKRQCSVSKANFCASRHDMR